MDAMDRLSSLRVADVMTTDVVCVGAHETMEEAARQMLQHHCSAAPVVDEKGQCVGILSATDFLSQCSGTEDVWPRGVSTTVRPGTELESLDIETTPSGGFVKDYMTAAVQGLRRDESLLQAARILCTAHIHRLVVLDDHQPVGIVSSMDIVSAVLKVLDESSIAEFHQSRH